MKGILLVNKKIKKTSFSIVSQLRKITNIKKIGHAGTLDPFASGLMIMLIGRNYTKKASNFISLDKEYIATLNLGIKTASFDMDTDIIDSSKKIPTFSEIEYVIEKNQGTVWQIPPMYSAKKIDGQKLYNLARKGKTIKREAVKISLQIDFISYEYPLLKLRINCSKGTYIRALADDIGESLKTFAALRELTRVRIGRFTIDQCIDQDNLKNLKKEDLIKDEDI